MTAVRRILALQARSGAWEPEVVADALDVVAGSLRAGLPPVAALRIAIDATDWGSRERVRLEHVIEAVARGGPSGPSWHQEGDGEEASDAYRALGAIWDLATETGAPLADAVLTVAGHLREDARVQGRLNALAAGPRTSQRLLTLLPVVGPLLAILVGADLADLYLASPVGAGAACVGGILTVIGWRWSRSMVHAAARPRTYSDAVGSGSR